MIRRIKNLPCLILPNKMKAQRKVYDSYKSIMEETLVKEIVKLKSKVDARRSGNK